MATQPLLPNPENCTLEELVTAANAAPNVKAHIRLMAIVMVFKGLEPAAVADIYSITQRSMYNWIRRFNERGIDGLLDRPRSGRPRKIDPERDAELVELIEHPEKAGVVHWTGKKFHGYLREKLDLEIGYRTTIRWIHEKDFRLKVPQPWPDRQDEEARQAFVERLQQWLQDEEVELWFGDETGIEGDPRPRRRWIKKGEKGRVTKNGDHIRMNVMGIVCPRQGEFFALEFSHSDLECFQAFLDEANELIEFDRPRNLLILDNASWHKCKAIEWGRFEPIYLPAYSPDLNPIERLWGLLKAEWFTDFIAKSRDELVERLDESLCWVIGRKIENQRTCRIKKEL